MATNPWVRAAGLILVVSSVAALFLTRPRGPEPAPRGGAEIVPDRTRVVGSDVADDVGAIVGAIVGSVVRDDDLPEAGATLTLTDDTGSVLSTTSDSAGRFRFGDVPAGAAHALRVDVARAAIVVVPGLRVLPRETYRLGDVALEATGRLDVLVTDESGVPIAGASVAACRDADGELASVIEHDPAPGGAAPAATATTGADGRTGFDVPVRAGWAVVATAPGRARGTAAAIFAPAGASASVALQLPPAEHLALRIVDADGRAVARARVAARMRPDVWDTYHGTLAESRALWTHHDADDDGRVEVGALLPGIVEILAAEPGRGLRYATSVLVPGVRDADVAVRPTAAVAGRVTDRETGAPIPGATVSFQCGGGVLVGGRTVTGPDGTYRLEDVPVLGSEEDSGSDAFTVTIRPPQGWYAERWTGVRPGALRPGETRTVDASFARSGTVTGCVTFRGPDPAAPPRPVDGAAVTVFVLTPEGDRTLASAHTRADREGRFRLDDAPTGRALLFAREPGEGREDEFSSFWRTVTKDPAAREGASFDVAPGATVVRDAQIERGAPPQDRDEQFAAMERRIFADHRTVYVHGRLTAEGSPPLRAKVAVDSWGDAPNRDFGRRVAPDGTWGQRCRLAPERDRIQVLAWDDVHDDSAVAEVVVPKDATELRVDLVLPRRPAVRGRIVCEGRPVAGAMIVRHGTLLARTSPAGEFEARFVTGEHEVGITAPGCVRTRVTWPVPCDPVEVELAPAGEIAGVVVDAAGNPVAGVVVTPVGGDETDGPDADPVRPYGERSHVAAPSPPTTDARGEFRITELPPGIVRLRIVSAPDVRPPVARAVSGPVAVGTTGVRLVAGASRSVSGRVVRDDGRPVRRARVGIESDDDDPGDDVSLDARLDGDGRFAFEGLPPGTYRLVVRPAPSEELVPVSRTVEGGAVVEIVLESASEIRGWILDDAGAPVTSIGVVAIPVGAHPPGTPASVGDLEAITDARGEFRIVVPPRRTYRVDLVARARYMSHWLLDSVLEVPAGATGLRLGASQGIAVNGTVSDRSGTPVAGAEVTLALPAGGTRTAVTDAAGGYAFRVANEEPAPVVVRARKDGFAAAERADVAPGSDHVNLILRR